MLHSNVLELVLPDNIAKSHSPWEKNTYLLVLNETNNVSSITIFLRFQEQPVDIWINQQREVTEEFAHHSIIHVALQDPFNSLKGHV